MVHVAQATTPGSKSLRVQALRTGLGSKDCASKSLAWSQGRETPGLGLTNKMSSEFISSIDTSANPAATQTAPADSILGNQSSTSAKASFHAMAVGCSLMHSAG